MPDEQRSSLNVPVELGKRRRSMWAADTRWCIVKMISWSTVWKRDSFQPKKFTNNSNFLLSVLPFPSLSADGTMWTPSTKSEIGKSTCMKRKRSTKKIKKDAVNRDSEVCNYWLPCSRVLERKRALPEMSETYGVPHQYSTVHRLRRGTHCFSLHLLCCNWIRCLWYMISNHIMIAHGQSRPFIHRIINTYVLLRYFATSFSTRRLRPVDA